MNTHTHTHTVPSSFYFLFVRASAIFVHYSHISNAQCYISHNFLISFSLAFVFSTQYNEYHRRMLIENDYFSVRFLPLGVILHWKKSSNNNSNSKTKQKLSLYNIATIDWERNEQSRRSYFRYFPFYMHFFCCCSFTIKW